MVNKFMAYFLIIVGTGSSISAREATVTHVYVAPTAGVTSELTANATNTVVSASGTAVVAEPRGIAGMSLKMDEMLIVQIEESRPGESQDEAAIRPTATPKPEKKEQRKPKKASVHKKAKVDPKDQGYQLSRKATSKGDCEGVTEAYAKFMERYRRNAQILSIEFGIPWEAVMAQGILESSKKDSNGVNIPGTSAIARDKNNFFGIGAYGDSPYRNALSYSSPEEGWRGYYKNIRKQSTYRAHGVFSGDAVTDPHAYLQCIAEAGYATGAYTKEVDPLIYKVERYAKHEGWYTSAELAEHNPKMLESAAANRK